jgi:hypothetical protein
MLNDLEVGMVLVKIWLPQQQRTGEPGRCDGAQRCGQRGQRRVARQQAAEQAADEEGRCQFQTADNQQHQGQPAGRLQQFLQPLTGQGRGRGLGQRHVEKHRAAMASSDGGGGLRSWIMAPK